MANNLKSMVRVIANDEAIAMMDERLEKCQGNDITSFAKAFYDEVEMGESGGVLNKWSFDNLGSKWTYLYDFYSDDEFSIESAYYPPKEFFVHLYKMLSEIDPESIIEVKYEDEGFDPIGAIVIKKGENGEPVIYQDEDDEMEDPTIDMDWDDENYDQTQMEFMEEIAERQDEMLANCYDMIDEGLGEPIYEMEDKEE